MPQDIGRYRESQNEKSECTAMCSGSSRGRKRRMEVNEVKRQVKRIKVTMMERRGGKIVESGVCKLARTVVWRLVRVGGCGRAAKQS